ncbi:MAG: helix-turn-helix domain-containing protein [Gemmataceae bacterium]|nr:helix-turn-helix domain-containing protein [Gemmataceae bacterium]
MRAGVSPKGKREVEGVTPSSGNVFADLGIPDAGVALAKANLAHRICEVIREKKLSQTKAAAILGVTQPKVSDLVRGKLDGFTVDRLLKFLNRLGQDVEISVRPAKGAKRPADTRVVYA